MLHWSNSPPNAGQPATLPILRAPTGHALSGPIVSSDLIGTRTHFHHGRTTPCLSPKCEACDDGNPWRWHGYIIAYGLKSGGLFILELTPSACEPLVAWRQHYSSLRGSLLTIWRRGTRPNSQVASKLEPYDLATNFLPPEPDLFPIMARIWNIPLSQIRPPTPDLPTKIIQRLADPGNFAPPDPNGNHDSPIFTIPPPGRP